jgi:glutamine synthetase
MAVVESGPNQVQRVLAKGPIADPFPTLDAARTDPGRLERIRQIRKQIDELGIKYIFFQQVSISGHVNGKGVVATQWENVAEAGYQLVYGATADLFVDRHDRYIGFGSPGSTATATTPRPASRSSPIHGRT